MACPVALYPRKRETAQSLRKLAVTVATIHPEMGVHLHLRDAASELEHGNHEGAKRHMAAAMHALAPQNLNRHGVLDDAGHTSAKFHMDQVHRHWLQVRDIEDADARNKANLTRTADATLSDAPGPQPGNTIPNGPRPTAQQGAAAMNAPARTSSGGTDAAAARPSSPQPRGSKQFASVSERTAVVVARDLLSQGVPYREAIGLALATEHVMDVCPIILTRTRTG